jgi:hypothetical protein
METTLTVLLALAVLVLPIASVYVVVQRITRRKTGKS